ncbi:MAG: hypothetical protein J6A26_07130 [Oscillospiraceae bacterium]|nr:hypothetical protein [Oscillospiraceae bacterium]
MDWKSILVLFAVMAAAALIGFYNGYQDTKEQQTAILPSVAAEEIML